MKICSICHQDKPYDDYYCWRGTYRGECKKCTIRKNVKRKKEKGSGTVDLDARRQYHREYYAKNKEKFKEYRKAFLERHPSYYKDQYQKSKR